MKKIALFAAYLAVTGMTFGQQEKQVPAWSKDAAMYELNVRQFSEEGTFEAIYDDIPRLKAMGIDILWLMPIHPIGEKNRKGPEGSYYAVKDYKAINPKFGDEASFKKLVEIVHENDMKIIIDWVGNHTSPDNVWVEAGNMDWYNLDSTGNVQPPPGTDWTDVSDLNYDNQDMRAAMIDAMEYWVADFDIDGYRCDVAGWVPTDFWNDARAALDKIKPVFMLAEDEGAGLHENAFDMTYGWEFHHVLNEVAKGHRNADSIVAYFGREAEKFESNAYRLHFTSNHDENSWNGTEYERMGDGVEAFAVLSATIHGMPLVYNGQEMSLKKRLEFFEKDAIQWTEEMDKEEFYTQLLNFKDANPALWNGDFGAYPEFFETDNPNVLAYVRRKGGNVVVCLLNLSNEKQKVNVSWINVTGEYQALFGKAGKLKCEKTEYNLEPWHYSVWYK
ncbi:MAG: alpha-amylase [Fluviicola sp. XM-24bin1]|nr:MAG: alpha-amylase [Fluviicola sp. XM-24bin1]